MEKTLYKDNTLTAEDIKNLRPRNKITLRHLAEVLRYLFTFTFLRELVLKIGYFIHDHVAPRAQMHTKENPRIHPTASLRYGRNIYLGINSHINQNCCVWASKNAKIVIGDNVLMGPGCKLFSSNHSNSNIDIPMNIQPYVEKDIIVGNDVWLGAGSIILAGVKVGDGSVVAAGSVVSKDVPDFTIVAGVTAKAIKKRGHKA